MLDLEHLVDRLPPDVTDHDPAPHLSGAPHRRTSQEPHWSRTGVAPALTRSSVAARQPDPPATAALRPIFVVDDSAICRLLVGQYLTTLGLGNPQVPLTDGTAAVRALTSCAEAGASALPALMLLDGQLPGATGLEVLEWMRTVPALGAVPVIVLSSCDRASAVNQAYALGARSYLVKPVGLGALGAVIRDLGLPWSLA